MDVSAFVSISAFFAQRGRVAPWPLQGGRRGHTIPRGHTEPTKGADLDIYNDHENDIDIDIDSDNENDDTDDDAATTTTTRTTRTIKNTKCGKQKIHSEFTLRKLFPDSWTGMHRRRLLQPTDTSLNTLLSFPDNRVMLVLRATRALSVRWSSKRCRMIPLSPRTTLVWLWLRW